MVQVESNMGPVNHPSHYNQGSIEAIDAMVAAFGVEAVVSFCKINAFKYIWRAGCKEDTPDVEDMRKAQWYIDKAISLKEQLQVK